MASLSASLLLTLVLSGCGSGGGTTPTVPVLDAPGTIPALPLPLPTVPLDIPVADLVVDPGPESGSVTLRFTAPGDETGTPADAYRVLTSVRHFDAASLDRASTVPVSASPSAPGTREALVLRGLAPDRTLVFGVQAVRAGTIAPLGLTASGHVSGRDVPTSNPGAIPLDGPATLSGNGATYLLTRDITTAGTAFVVTGRDVTLDLGGHTVTYGTGSGRAYGVQADEPAGPGTTTVRNGRIVQGGGSGTWSHAVVLQSLQSARISYLSIDVHGPDAHGIWVAEADGTVRVDHCDVACRTTTVSNRHYPGVSAIFVEQTTGALEIDQNRITATPQWGIQVEGRSSSSPCLIHHNRVVGTKALVANGYMIAVHKPDADVYENQLDGESRGIHVDEVDTSGRNAWIHDNHLNVQDQPNAEYPDRHWVHGIKVEAANGCIVERNRVRGRRRPHPRGRVRASTSRWATPAASRSATTTWTPCPARRACTPARSTSPTARRGLPRTTSRSPRTSSARRTHSSITTGTADAASSAGTTGGCGTSRSGRGTRSASSTSGTARASRRAATASSMLTATSPFRRSSSGRPRARTTRHGEWTLTVAARNGGAPVAGAAVTVRNSAGSTVFTATTDAAGIARGIVLGTRVERGPSFAAAGPYQVTVESAGSIPGRAHRRSKLPRPSSWTWRPEPRGRTRLLPPRRRS